MVREQGSQQAGLAVQGQVPLERFDWVRLILLSGAVEIHKGDRQAWPTRMHCLGQMLTWSCLVGRKGRQGLRCLGHMLANRLPWLGVPCPHSTGNSTGCGLVQLELSLHHRVAVSTGHTLYPPLRPSSLAPSSWQSV